MYLIDNFPFGNKTKAYRLTNKQGMQVVLTDFGARIVQILLPVEANGGLRNVSLACQSSTEYVTYAPYVGASIVPVAGRIFTKQGPQVAGQELHLLENGPGYSLHSGPHAANLQIWETTCNLLSNSITFSICLADGYNGFPGPIHLQAVYRLRDDSVLEVCYKARSERTTLFNPTNHVFFNLSGNFQEDVGRHILQVNADKVLLYDSFGRPVTIQPVEDSPFDFRKGKPLSAGLRAVDPQLRLFGGFDHFWYVNDKEHAASVTSPDGKIRLRVATNQNGLVIYTYNNNQPHLAVKHGVFSLECLAAQHQRRLLQPQQSAESWAQYAFDF